MASYFSRYALWLNLPGGCREVGSAQSFAGLKESRFARLPAVVVAGAVVAIAVLLGLSAALLPLTATLGIEALLLLAISMAVIWKLLRGYSLTALPQPAALPSPTSGDQAGARGRIRPDTLLFFMGAATVAEVKWRPGNLTLSDVFFVASFVWCCASVVWRRRPFERLPTLLTLGLGLYAIGGTLSAIGAAAQGQSLYEVVRGVWTMLLWPWTAVMVLRHRRDVLIAVVLWLVSGTFDALGALGQTTGLSSIAGQIGVHRATGFSGSPNDLGGAAGTLLVPALALAIKFRPRLPVVRALVWLCVGLVAASLVVSGSLSGISGALVALALWIVSPDVRRATRVGAVLALAGALVITSSLGSSVPSPVHRVQEVFAPPGSSANAGSGQAHLDTITFAWPRIRSDPIIGAGLDRANLLVHSAPVVAWYGGGIFALAGFLLIFGAVFSYGW